MDAVSLLAADNLVFSDHEGLLHGAESFSLKAGAMGLVRAEDHSGAVTFLKTLVFLHQRRSGTVRWFGSETDEFDHRNLTALRRRIGLLHRDSVLLSNLSLHENLALGMEFHRTDWSIDLGTFISNALELVDPKDKSRFRPGRLSALERYRALLLRELIKGPEVLLLEEPHLCIGFSWFDDLPVLAEGLGLKNVPALLVVSTVELADNADTWMIGLAPIHPGSSR